MRYMVEMVRPWWRFWRSDRMFKDQADHEWTTWKISALQGNSQMLEKLPEMFFFAVGIYVALYPAFSWITKTFLKEYSLAINVILTCILLPAK